MLKRGGTVEAEVMDTVLYDAVDRKSVLFTQPEPITVNQLTVHIGCSGTT